jgi:NAD(P)-dependent dehydrogenase (short-subunit alcohol dehydrogenase family)
MTVLRDNLLAGRVIAVAGSAPRVALDALTALGGRVELLEPGLDEAGAEEWARARAPLHALLYDARGAFAAGGGAEALRNALEQAWVAVRAVAAGALIPAGAGGKLILLAARPDAGGHAEAARSGLENLARTLSVEWARYLITAIAIAPGPHTTDGQLAELLAFLASPAGEYFSGCRLELGSVGQTPGS